MEKITIQVEPEIQDYARAITAYSTRKRSYWIGLGVTFISCLAMLIVSIANIQMGRGNTSLLLVFIAFVIMLLSFYPFWSGWIITKKMKKNDLATLVTTYVLDEEKVSVSSSMSETTFLWSLFAQAFEDGEYFLFGYSSNKNMVQFIPKRSFESEEQESLVRSLITQKLGAVENIRKGFTGWKLALVSALLSLLFFGCVVVIAFSIALLI